MRAKQTRLASSRLVRGESDACRSKAILGTCSAQQMDQEKKDPIPRLVASCRFSVCTGLGSWRETERNDFRLSVSLPLGLQKCSAFFHREIGAKSEGQDVREQTGSRWEAGPYLCSIMILHIVYSFPILLELEVYTYRHVSRVGYRENGQQCVKETNLHTTFFLRFPFVWPFFLSFLS